MSQFKLVISYICFWIDNISYLFGIVVHITYIQPFNETNTWIYYNYTRGKIWIFASLNTCLCHTSGITQPLSHPFITPFWNTSVFFMQNTSRFFRLVADDININNKETRRNTLSIKTVKICFNEHHSLWFNHKSSNVIIHVVSVMV